MFIEIMDSLNKEVLDNSSEGEKLTNISGRGAQRIFSDAIKLLDLLSVTEIEYGVFRIPLGYKFRPSIFQRILGV